MRAFGKLFRDITHVGPGAEGLLWGLIRYEVVETLQFLGLVHEEGQKSQSEKVKEILAGLAIERETYSDATQPNVVRLEDVFEELSVSEHVRSIETDEIIDTLERLSKLAGALRAKDYKVVAETLRTEAAEVRADMERYQGFVNSKERRDEDKFREWKIAQELGRAELLELLARMIVVDNLTP